LQRLKAGPLESIEDESAAYDRSAHPRALAIIAIETEGADCNGKDEKAISKGENCP
jgi:hypothetical protein